MKQLKCIAIDDEPLALALIKTYVDATAYLQLIGTFEDAIAAAEHLNQFPVDLLFLDINMPDISGIDLFKSLHVKPMVIFTTAYKNFAFEGFELNAIDYLLKPIDYIRFKKAAQKALDFHLYQTQKALEIPDGHLFVYAEYKLIKIEIKDIRYLESLEDYVKIHLHDGKMIMTLTTLKKLIDKLPSDKFRRIHRSYVVAVKCVKQVANRKAYLDKDFYLPISDTHVDFINEWKKNDLR